MFKDNKYNLMILYNYTYLLENLQYTKINTISSEVIKETIHLYMVLIYTMAL